MKYSAFDLEIVNEIPEGEMWQDYRPLGISCAALLNSDTNELFTFYHGQPGDPLAGAMTSEELYDLVYTMLQGTANGFVPLTWNGLQFDFPVLAEESGLVKECKELALKSVDMMFHFFCVKGYPIGLDTVAKGLGLSGKTEGMSGELAPKLWALDVEDRKRVLEYVGQDVISTMEVALKTEAQKFFNWIARSGRKNNFWLGDGGWRTVEECLTMPLPDRSWMSNPIPLEQFTGWLNEV